MRARVTRHGLQEFIKIASGNGDGWCFFEMSITNANNTFVHVRIGATIDRVLKINRLLFRVLEGNCVIIIIRRQQNILSL